MRDAIWCSNAGKRMTLDEARKVGSKTMTGKLFKKQTPGLLYDRGELREDKHGKN